MTDLNERVETLEQTINELQIDLHASKIAITVLSSVINNMSGNPSLLSTSYEEEKSSAPLVKFNHPEQEGYEDKVTERVLALLAKSGQVG